jgi:hypothetical protein
LSVKIADYPQTGNKEGIAKKPVRFQNEKNKPWKPQFF